MRGVEIVALYQRSGSAKTRQQKERQKLARKRLAAKRKGGCDTAETERRRPEQEERV
jgi:hypothetical protein